MIVTGYLCCSAQRRYMRSSISAKSEASTPPGTGADRDDRGTLVVLAVEQRLHLELADDVLELGELVTGLFGGVLVVHLVGELDHDLEVVEAALDAGDARELGLAVAQRARDLLRLVGVVPEIGSTGLFAEPRDLGGESPRRRPRP